MKKLILSVLLLGTLMSSSVVVYAEEPKKAEVQNSEASEQAVEGSKIFDGAKEKLATLKGKTAESIGDIKEKFATFKGKTADCF